MDPKAVDLSEASSLKDFTKLVRQAMKSGPPIDHDAFREQLNAHATYNLDLLEMVCEIRDVIENLRRSGKDELVARGYELHAVAMTEFNNTDLPDKPDEYPKREPLPIEKSLAHIDFPSSPRESLLSAEQKVAGVEADSGLRRVCVICAPGISNAEVGNLPGFTPEARSSKHETSLGPVFWGELDTSGANLHELAASNSVRLIDGHSGRLATDES